MAEGKDGHWVEHMVDHMKKGALHRATDTPAGKDISAKKEAKAEHSKSPSVRKEAEVAATLARIRNK